MAIMGYTLWLFVTWLWYRWPIEIDGLPIDSMVIFNSYVKLLKIAIEIVSFPIKNGDFP